MKRLAMLSAALLLVACSGGEDRAKNDKVDEHIWKSQTDMIDKARNLEGLLQDSAAAKQHEINRQAGQQAE